MKITNNIITRAKSRLSSHHFVGGIAMCMMLFSMSSCTFEQDDYFDESASLRLEHANEQIKASLVAASAEGQHGWLIQYFVGNESAEGFNLFGKFTASGKVTLGSDHRFLRNGNAYNYTEASSLYEMLNDEGSVLSFNSWNDVLTVLEDPVDPSFAPSAIYQDGVGLLGDHNLVVISHSDTLMLMRGERNRGNVRFVKLDCEPAQYLKDVEAMKAVYCSDKLDSYYYITNHGTSYLVGLSKGYYDIVDRLEDPLQTNTGSCVFTRNGFMTENLSEFVLSDDKSCLINKTSGVKLVALWDKYIADYEKIWTIQTLPANLQAKYDELAKILKSINPAWELQSVGLGNSTGGDFVNGLVFQFKTQAATAKTIGMSLYKASEKMGELTIGKPETFEYDINLGIVDNMTTEDIKAVMQGFAQELYGTYTLTPDNPFLPTAFSMTNGTNTLNFKQ